MKRSITRSLTGACALLALAATLAACSSGSSASKGASAIKIEMIYDGTTSTGASNQPEDGKAAQARADAINAAGGINGHTLQLTLCDTKTDPNTATQCARQAVSDKVAAVVGTTTNNEAQVFPILQAAHIPAIGTVPFTNVSAASDINFSFDSGVVGSFVAAAELLKSRGANRIAILAPNLGATNGAVTAFKAGAKLANADVASVINFAPTQVQFDAQVATLVSAHVDGVLAFGHGTAQQTALIKAIRAQAPNLLITTVVLSPQVISALGSQANGVTTVGLGQPATSSAPGIKQMNTDLNKYAASYPRTDLSINAWSAVWTFEQIAKTLKTINAATVLAKMATLSNFNMGGIYPPVTTTKKFTEFPGFPTVYNPTVVYQTVRDGKVYAQTGNYIDPFKPQT